MKYWLHRISGGENAIAFSYPLLFKNNLLSIGWSCFSREDFLNDVQQRGMIAIEEKYKQKGWELSRNRHCLGRFLFEMEKGDRVVVPTWKSFSVFEIISDKIYCNETIDKKLYFDSNGNPATYSNSCFYKDGKAIDLGFYREVRLISKKEMAREDYADQALYSRMKVRQTNVNIEDLSSSVEKAINNSLVNKTINIKEIKEDFSQKLLVKIREMLKDNSFETLVEGYLKSIGGEVMTPSKNESGSEYGDADKVAFFEKLKTVVMVQIKKHVGKTGDGAVQQITEFELNHNFGDEYFTQLWVVSTCDEFTPEAKSNASEKGVRLIDGREFCNMILESGLSCLNLL